MIKIKRKFCFYNIIPPKDFPPRDPVRKHTVALAVQPEIPVSVNPGGIQGIPALFKQRCRISRVSIGYENQKGGFDYDQQEKNPDC